MDALYMVGQGESAAARVVEGDQASAWREFLTHQDNVFEVSELVRTEVGPQGGLVFRREVGGRTWEIRLAPRSPMYDGLAV